MKLSEAMRKGWLLVGKQAFDCYFEVGPMDLSERHRVVAACALGCAYLGLHPEALNEAPSVLTVGDELTREFKDDFIAGLFTLAANLNDHHHRPVPHIIGWLESIGA